MHLSHFAYIVNVGSWRTLRKKEKKPGVGMEQIDIYKQAMTK